MNSDEMAAQTTTGAELVQTTATIAKASEIFASNDPGSPMAIVIVPRYQNRLINLPLIAAAVLLLTAFATGWWQDSRLLPATIGLIALLLAVLGVRQALMVMIPEGMNALLTQGKYKRTVGPGYHTLKPRVVVSHLVTARAIPYAVSIRQAPTADLVRGDVDCTITFVIDDPARIVFKTSTGAFDEILQASCQGALRAMLRRRTAAEINDLTVEERDDLLERLTSDVEAYGVKVTNISITRALLPEPFMQSQEARQLAILQQAEQAEQQTLALRRQADRVALERQDAVAEVERQREVLRRQTLEAEARRQVAEMDAETLRCYPEAVQLEALRMRLEVARALATNSRTIVHIQTASDFERALSTDVESVLKSAAPNGARRVTDKKE